MRSFVDLLPCPAVCVDGDHKDVRWRIPTNPTAAPLRRRPEVRGWIEQPAEEAEVPVMLAPVTDAG